MNENNVSIKPDWVSLIYKRKLRSLTERILLIRAELLYYMNYIEGIDFTILGSSNKIYNVEIWRNLIVEPNTYDICYSCSCPDHQFRGNICKHVYWVGTKFFHTMDPENWSLLDYNRIITKYWINENKADHTGRNEDCPICLETINYQTESTICCTYECYNAVHAVCWGRYNDISGSTKCIFCRANSMPNF